MAELIGRSPSLHLHQQTHVTPASFRDRALHKLVQEINFLKAQAVEPLYTFLEYIT
jgi:hypothetical protein